MGIQQLLLAGGSWNPGNLTVPPSIWLDEASSLTNVSGAASLWSNRGSAGGAYGQSTAANRPTINATGLNNLRTLTFDGTNDYMGSNDAAILAAFQNKPNAWVFHVFKKTALDGGVTNRGLVTNSPGNSGGGGRFSLGLGTPVANRLYIYTERVDGAAGSLLQATSTLTTNWTMALVTVNWAGTAAAIYIDGSLDTSSSSYGTAGSTSNTAGFWPAGIGAFPASPVVVFADQSVVCSMQGANGLPSAGEIDKLFGYAAWRYGLVGNLPGGHPYKNAPPTM